MLLVILALNLLLIVYYNPMRETLCPIAFNYRAIGLYVNAIISVLGNGTEMNISTDSMPIMTRQLMTRQAMSINNTTMPISAEGSGDSNGLEMDIMDIGIDIMDNLVMDEDVRFLNVGFSGEYVAYTFLLGFVFAVLTFWMLIEYFVVTLPHFVLPRFLYTLSKGLAKYRIIQLPVR